MRCASTCSTTTGDILVQSAATCQLVFALGGPNKRGAGSYFDAFGSQFVLLLSVLTFWRHLCWDKRTPDMYWRIPLFLEMSNWRKVIRSYTLPINQGLSLDTFLSPERWGARHRNSCELTSCPSCTLIKKWVCDNRRQWWHRNIWIVRELWETCPATLATGKRLDLGCVPMRKDPKDIWRTSFTVPNKTCCLHHISTTTVPFSSWVWSWRAAPSIDVQSAMAAMYTRMPPKPGLSFPWDMHESTFLKYVKYIHLNPKL